MSIFVRASCGCVVIPMRERGSETQCLCVRPCEGDQPEWTFFPRWIDTHKVKEKIGHDYSRDPGIPGPVSDEDEGKIIRAIGSLVILGYTGREMAKGISLINDTQIPSL